ncbi:MAG TPA: hypothetical protein VD766_14115 [Solirubrobacterales bacterium]|nr:hypothetical protein [Solirubrobacterales bacterium]
MGVFDDAIREHLELKRQKGADEEELKELENEAFGQAARPGDPDFPGSTGEEEAVQAESPGDEAVPAEVAPSEAEPPGAEEENKPFDMASEPDPVDELAPSPAADVVPQDEEQAPAEPPAEEIPPPDETASEETLAPEAVEPETKESTELSEPAAEAPAEPLAEELAEPESPFSTAEREAIADQPTVFFDQAPAEMELGDLELDLDEEIEEVGGAVSEPLPDEEPLGVEEVFTEEPATEVAEPPHEVEPEPAPPEEPPLEPAPSDPDAEAEPGTGEDDVLEETPEFLRDNPDDDELWFEQGEPKDFDF